MMYETANGYKLLECASALQKSIRRGLEEQSLFWAAELETKYWDYLWKRLVVIANEDIGIADPQVITLVETLRTQYFFLRKKNKGPAERLPLCNAILAMCRAKKTRLTDDMVAVVYRRREFKNWRLEIPDFALDRHTAKGRALGRGVDHWRDEGCKLSNETKGMNPYEAEATMLRETTGKIERNSESTGDPFEEKKR
jgi:replication-associated recombination protein RarA